MKKIYLLILFMMITKLVTAQFWRPESLYITIQTGGTHSWITASEDPRHNSFRRKKKKKHIGNQALEPLGGAHLGITVLNLNTTSGIMLEPGIRYVTRGFRQGSRDIRLGYVDFFMRLKLNTQRGRTSNDSFGFFPFVGISYSRLIQARNDDIDKNNFFLKMGVDLVQDRNIAIGFEYTNGLSDISNRNSNIRRFNESIMFTVSYRVQLF
jgi:hypothetical protein